MGKQKKWILLLVLAFAALSVFISGGLFARTSAAEGALPSDSPEEDKNLYLSFDSFAGGGPEFSLEVEDPSIVSWTRETVWEEHAEELDGASFTAVYTLTGLRPGETRVTVLALSPIAGNIEYLYYVKVDENLKATVTVQTETWLDNMLISVPSLVIRAGDRVFYAEPEDNPSAEAFIDMLSYEPQELEMHDNGGFEKFGSLLWSLPRYDEDIAVEPGDIVLYEGDRVLLCYDCNTRNATLLARIGGVTREELLEILGDGDVTVSFWVEWSE